MPYSKKEFLKSIGTCRKEARETRHFLRNSRSRRAGVKTRGPRALDGSARTAPDFLEDLEKRESMMKHKRRNFSSFDIVSSFDI
jgi:hypothetical protein